LFRVKGTLRADVTEMNLAAQVLRVWRGRKFEGGVALLNAARKPLTSDLLWLRYEAVAAMRRLIWSALSEAENPALREVELR
jgi:hypothetical protein